MTPSHRRRAMNRRAIERTLDSLTRAELRDLALELTDWIGADATARLVPSGPFVRAGSEPQLQLAAVDTTAAAAKLAHVRSVALAAIRASSEGDAALAATVSTDATAEAVHAGLAAAVTDAAAAVRFELRGGLAFADELLDSLERLAQAEIAFHATWRSPVPSLAPLLVALSERVATASIDEAVFRAILEVCRLAVRVGADAWPVADAAVASPKNPRAVRWLERALENQPPLEMVLPLLDLLGRHAPDVDGFVQHAELHLNEGPAVFALMAETLMRHGRATQARFWIGEGRRRFPHVQTLVGLEERLAIV